MTQTELAADCFKRGFNCAQAVFSTLAPELGVPVDQALRICAAFACGVGRTGNVCGAVTGALMATGLRLGSVDPADTGAKDSVYRASAEIMSRFEAVHGSILCRDLLGLDPSTAAGRALARERGLFDTLCPGLVSSAVEIVRAVAAFHLPPPENRV